jgi:hypothetical protein
VRLIREKASGELQSVASLDGYDPALFDDLGAVPEGLDPMLVYVDDSGAIVEGLAPLWTALRARRDALLYVTDGTQAADRPEDYRAAWAAYREALRALPESVSDPREAVWPTPPDAEELDRMRKGFAAAGGGMIA